MIKDDNGQTSILLLCGFILIVLGILIFVITIGSVVGMFTGITCIVFGVLLRILFYFREGRKRRKRIQEEIDASRAKRRKKEQEREEEIEKFKDENGECDKVIIYKDFRLEVYDKAQKLIFNGTLYSFSDILSCDFIEKDNIETTSVVVGHKEEVMTTYTTKTSGKSLAGRALVGGVIAGPVGAIIGGSTAKRTTIAENHVTLRPILGTKEYKSKIYRLLIMTTKSKFAQVFVTAKKAEAVEVKEVFDNIIKTNSTSL